MPRYKIAFQMQVVRNGEVIFAVEQTMPNERQVREMSAECVRMGARLSELRLVSKDSDLYEGKFAPEAVN